MHAEMRDGTRLFFTTHGRGVPLLVVHGGPGLDHTYLRPWLDPLGEIAELIYFDQRGQGRSDRPASADVLNDDTWVDDIDRLRSSLGHDRVVLFGHSYGGGLAQQYALAHPDRLHGLILCCTTPVMDFAAAIANARARATPLQFQDLTEGLAGPLADDRTFQETWMKILPIYFHRYSQAIGEAMDAATIYNAAAFNRGFFDLLPQYNTLERVSLITAATLVLAGRHDWVMPPAIGAERLHSRLPNSQLTIFEESGHFPFIEEQPALVATVARWLRDLNSD